MLVVRIELLGGFSARLEDGRPCTLPTRKAQALLAYLAVSPARPHSRDTLTALLWGDTSEAQARQNFRQTLLRLRRTLGDTVLLTDHDNVALCQDAVAVDVAELEAAAAGTSADALERAAMLYRGDFLAGFRLDEAPFEEWRMIQRERLHELALEALTRLLHDYVEADRVEPASRTALRLLALDPLQEAVHRTLMRLLSRQGRRAAALQQYQACVGWLERELGTEPEEETRTLYRELLRGSHSSREGTRTAAVVGHRPETSIVGRRDELEAMTRALDRALDEGGRVVLLSGEAGIGKTRLIQELGAAAADRGAKIVAAWCHETEQPLPFRPWVDALRGDAAAVAATLGDRMSAATRAFLVRVFPELGSADGPPVTTTADEHALLFEAVNVLVHRLAEDAPLVVVLEDLHWADAMSLRLLAFVGRRLGSLPVLLVGSVRAEETLEAPMLERALEELRAAGALDEVALGALDRNSSIALARGVYSRGKPSVAVEAIADDLWALSEGNPFVIVESMRAFKEAGTSAAPSLPHSVRQFLAARLARLSEPARHILSTAAVIGRASSFKLLALSTGIDEIPGAAAMEELVRRRLLETIGGRLVIAHDRIREVAYDDLSPVRRIALHAAAGRALETLHGGDLDEVANELGHHALRAGDHEAAIVYLERFSDVATRRYALDAAIDARRAALEAAEHLPPAIRDRRRLEIGMRQGVLFSLAARARDALALLQGQVPLLRRVGDPALASDHYFRLAITSHHLGQHVDARAAADAALREAERSGDAQRLGKARYAFALVEVMTGPMPVAIDHATRAAALLDASASVHWRGLSFWVLAWAHAYRGAPDPALEASARCAAIARQTGDWRLDALAAQSEAGAHIARGDAGAAMAAAETARYLSRDPVARGVSQLAIAEAHLIADQPRAAVDVLRAMVESDAAPMVPVSSARALGLLAEAYGVLGEQTAGAEAARQALALGEAQSRALVIGLGERTLGRLARASGDGARGEAYLSRALDRFLVCEVRIEAAMTRLDLARALVERNDPKAAREQLAGALRVFIEAGAPRRIAMVRDLATELGLDPDDL